MNFNIFNKYYQEDIIRILNTNIPWGKLYNHSILITGASGLLGSFLVDVLMSLNQNKNAHIHVFALGRNKIKIKDRFGIYFNNPDFTFLEQDITTQLDYKFSFSYIFHGAGNSHPLAFSTDPIGTINANVMGTINILNYAKYHTQCRVIFLSSGEIYGENRGDIDSFTEDYCGYINCNTQRACYPESKRVCESLCQSYKSLYEINVMIARLCRTYGSTMSDSDSKATAQFIRKAISGENIVLKSTGKQLYSFIYVADAISALLTILLKGTPGEAYNIANPESNIELRQFAETVANYSHKKVIFEFPDEKEKKGFSVIKKATLNCTKLLSLGWKPYYKIESGIKRTIQILNNNSL